MRYYQFSSIVVLTLLAFNVCSGDNEISVGSDENYQLNQSILVDNVTQKSTDFNYQEYRKDYKASISSSNISTLDSFENKYKDHDPDLLVPFVAEKKADLIAYWSSHAYSNYVNLNKCVDWEAFIIDGSLKNKYIDIAKTIVDLCAGGLIIKSTKEVELLQHAAEAGSIASMNRLAESFQKGHGVTINYLAAIDWYKKASSLNSTIAKLALGRFFTGGIGVESDISRAIEYFKEASELGSSAAKFELGKIYFYGNGIEKNYAEALRYFTESAAEITRSYIFIGDIYRSGLGVDINTQVALDNYQHFTVAATAEKNNLAKKSQKLSVQPANTPQEISLTEIAEVNSKIDSIVSERAAQHKQFLVFQAEREKAELAARNAEAAAKIRREKEEIRRKKELMKSPLYLQAKIYVAFIKSQSYKCQYMMDAVGEGMLLNYAIEMAGNPMAFQLLESMAQNFLDKC